MIIKAKLVAKDEILNGYSTYVFECLDEEIRRETKFLMCTRFPNWEHKSISLEDKGFLNFEERKAGIDQWYDIDTKTWNTFNYDLVQFIKFIPLKEKIDEEYII